MSVALDPIPKLNPRVRRLAGEFPSSWSPVPLAAALDMHARGFSLVPLEAGGKRPHFAALDAVHGTDGWDGLRGRRASLPEVRAWFEHDPAANLGLIITPGLVVVDVDAPERFDMALPATPTVRSARGAHFYLSGDVEGVIRHPWGEVRGAGSYVVVPPSIHETGHRYEWIIGLDVPLAPLPEGLSGRPEHRGGGGNTRTTVGPCVDGSDGRLGPTRDAGAVAKLMTWLGRPDALDPVSGRTREVRCLLADHVDARPSAGLYLSRDGAYRYRCHGCGRNLSLARLFAAVTSGEVDESDAMAAPTAARWLTRAWHEPGVAPVTVPAYASPAGCSPTARKLAEGFILLSGLRSVEENGADPVPYSHRFAARWCRLSFAEVRRGIAELLRHGWLVQVGHTTRAGRLYRVGVAWQTSPSVAVGQEVHGNDRQAAPSRVGVADEVGLPDRPLPLEPTGLIVGMEPGDERRHVRPVDRAEVVALAGGAPAPSGAAGGRGHTGKRKRCSGQGGRSDPEAWRFGIGQTAAREQAEIRGALHAGRADEYMRGRSGRATLALDPKHGTARRARDGLRERGDVIRDEQDRWVRPAAVPSPSRLA